MVRCSSLILISLREVVIQVVEVVVVRGISSARERVVTPRAWKELLENGVSTCRGEGTASPPRDSWRAKADSEASRISALADDLLSVPKLKHGRLVLLEEIRVVALSG